MDAGRFDYKGSLRGHGGWVTAIACPLDGSDLLLSSSRDKAILQWDTSVEARTSESYGRPKRALLGHSDFVQDVQISSDGQFALSGSWDRTLRLWELSSGATVHTCQGHSKDVTSVAFSVDNRQIVSGSRDRLLKVWNTLGECKFTIQDHAHKDWVSCVRFSPNAAAPVVVSAGWDKVVKVWSLTNFKLQQDLIGHKGYINSVTISPDGSLCASGGKDGVAMLWDLYKGEELYKLGDSSEVINAMTFSPNRYWLCAATESKIKIWDLETKLSVAELMPETDESEKGHKPECISLAWSSDGTTLYSGYTDNVIRVWGVTGSASG